MAKESKPLDEPIDMTPNVPPPTQPDPPMILSVAIDTTTGAANVASSTIATEEEFALLLDVLEKLTAQIRGQYISIIKEQSDGDKRKPTGQPS